MKLFKFVLFVLLYALLLIGCATTKGTTTQDKRHAILDMKKETLSDLYKVRPQSKSWLPLHNRPRVLASSQQLSRRPPPP